MQAKPAKPHGPYNTRRLAPNAPLTWRGSCLSGVGRVAPARRQVRKMRREERVRLSLRHSGGLSYCCCINCRWQGLRGGCRACDCPTDALTSRCCPLRYGPDKRCWLSSCLWNGGSKGHGASGLCSVLHPRLRRARPLVNARGKWPGLLSTRKSPRSRSHVAWCLHAGQPCNVCGRESRCRVYAIK